MVGIIPGSSPVIVSMRSRPVAAGRFLDILGNLEYNILNKTTGWMTVTHPFRYFKFLKIGAYPTKERASIFCVLKSKQ